MKDNTIAFACRMIVWKVRYEWHRLMTKYWIRRWDRHHHKHLVAWNKVIRHLEARNMIIVETNVYAERRNEQLGKG